MAKFTGHTITSDSALGDAKIQRSLRFDSADTTYLNRTPSSASNRKTWTWSSWVKRDQVSGGTNRYIFMAGQTDGNDNVAHISFDNNDRFRLYGVTGSFDYKMRTNGVYRDTSAWYHVMVTFDTTQATASNRIKLYVNGVQITDLGQSDYPSQNHDSYFNNNVLHNIGRYNSGSTQWFEGYMAEINFIDGYAYDSSYFGFTDPQTGIWMPKRYEGTYGTNGFHLDFVDNSSTAALGKDTSGNGNDWTTNNFSTGDSMLDTPSNNFCTFNSLDNDDNITVSEGGLKIQGAGSWDQIKGNIGVSSGKWYFEIEADAIGTTSGWFAGIHEFKAGANYVNTYWSQNIYTVADYGYVYSVWDNNKAATNTSEKSFSSDITAGDIVGFRVDLDNNEFSISVNGTDKGKVYDIQSDITYTPAVNFYGSGSKAIANFGQDSTFAGAVSRGGYTDEGGVGDFKYPVPSGYRAICSVNLPPKVPSIVRPQRHFDILTYSGNSSTQTITGLEFKPDLVWVKRRNGDNSHIWSDSVRGTTKYFVSHDTSAEGTNAAFLTAFVNGGFTSGNNGDMNGSDRTYVAWCWRAGGNSNTYNIDDVGYTSASAAGLDGGTINPTGASVNTKAGFSIISYTGNGTAGATIAHGLGKKPKWILLKRRDSSDNFYVYHHLINRGSNPEQYYSELNFHAGATDSDKIHNDTAPTTSVFSLKNDNASNGNSATYLAYCWAEIPGYSKFGEYRATGFDNNGPYIHLGFKPAWIMIKSMSLSNSDWVIFDNKRNTSNPTNNHLVANENDTEEADNYEIVDFLADGFRVTGLGGAGINYNTSYADVIYMAFAEQPTETPFTTFPNAR